MTLDSLGIAHSPTIRNLKQYLVQEAKAKRGLDIDIKDISGMTAKQIPQQANYCDCGLFLLGYTAKFLRDPGTLVHKILQRDIKEEDWVDLNPTDMRNVLRNILIKLNGEQESLRRNALREQAIRGGKFHEVKMKTKASQSLTGEVTKGSQPSAGEVGRDVEALKGPTGEVGRDVEAVKGPPTGEVGKDVEVVEGPPMEHVGKDDEVVEGPPTGVGKDVEVAEGPPTNALLEADGTGDISIPRTAHVGDTCKDDGEIEKGGKQQSPML
ncbi:MAG: hypothetical protein M1826_001391 [Phylliscum demangeonii]|nr:MAG: hypothetical protein M1826_001391 [Phylliscum demangeonii]